MTVAQRLRRLLDDRGATPAEAARAAGLHEQAVHAILRGPNDNPTIKTLRKIVEGVGGTLAELFADPE